MDCAYAWAYRHRNRSGAPMITALIATVIVVAAFAIFVAGIVVGKMT
jgi:hypothetical protein